MKKQGLAWGLYTRPPSLVRSHIMKRITFTVILAISVVWITCPVHAKTPVVNYKVKIEGKSYRIRVQGENVKAIPKAMLSAATLDQRDDLRKAVKVATGCEIIDEFWDDAKLAGKLKCTEQGTPLPPQ